MIHHAPKSLIALLQQFFQKSWQEKKIRKLENKMFSTNYEVPLSVGKAGGIKSGGNFCIISLASSGVSPSIAGGDGCCIMGAVREEK